MSARLLAFLRLDKKSKAKECNFFDNLLAAILDGAPHSSPRRAHTAHSPTALGLAVTVHSLLDLIESRNRFEHVGVVQRVNIRLENLVRHGFIHTYTFLLAPTC